MYETEARRNGKAVLWIVGGLAVAAILSCGGLVYWGKGAFAEIQKAEAEADAFMDLVGSGKLDEAYAAAAPAFRSKVTREQFGDTIKKYPAFEKQTRRSVGGIRINANPQGTRAFIQYNIANPSNTLSLMLVLVRADGRWKVESLNLP
jgi:hypothetical protein